MKARVKATGKIVEIVGEGIQNSNMVMAAHGEWFTKEELDIVPLSWKPFEPTYWQKLEHQAAIGAMQGILSNQNIGADVAYMVNLATECATALAKKLKEEEK